RQALIERFPDAPSRVSHATIQQAMFLANSQQMAALFVPDGNDAVSPATVEERVRAAFRRALIRDPDADELAQAVAFLNTHGDSPKAVGQLLGALASGPEFLTSH